MNAKPKYEFFIIPEHRRGDRTATREDLKQYEVTEAELRARFTEGQCIPSGDSETTCMCGNPPRPKTAHCTIYKNSVTGAYCYTTCESCVVVCGRP